jgi:hypothetical protein
MLLLVGPSFISGGADISSLRLIDESCMPMFTRAGKMIVKTAPGTRSRAVCVRRKTGSICEISSQEESTTFEGGKPTTSMELEILAEGSDFLVLRIPPPGVSNLFISKSARWFVWAGLNLDAPAVVQKQCVGSVE